MKITLETKYGKIDIGDNLPVHLISEIGLNHNGSVELAKQMIYQSALSGASMVKFQKRSPKDLATASFLDEPFSKCPVLGSTQREVRERLELSFDEYVELKEYAESLGLIFFATAFDIPSFDFLMRLNVQVMKIASHSITNGLLISKIAKSKIPVICSFGATTSSERDFAVNALKDNPLIIMHCVSSYPTPDNLVKIDTITHYKNKYNVPVGFSSHETGIDISVASSLLGACIIERHFTLNRSMIGLDHGISLLPDEFSLMASKINRLSAIRGVSEDIQFEEKSTKYKYHVAICSNKEFNIGHIISEEDIVCKQPLKDPDIYFTGIETNDILGKKVLVKIERDSQIPRESLS